MSSENKQKTVQCELGEAVVGAIVEFAIRDIDPADKLSGELFARVCDAQVRRQVAEILFGARWLYKLGLLTLATGERRAAHVRAQVVDYGAICEALILDGLAQGIVAFDLRGAWKPAKRKGSVVWSTGRSAVLKTLRERFDFRSLIEIAKHEGILSDALAKRLHWLRKQRNRVHIAEMAALAEKQYISTSRTAYGIVLECAKSVRSWIDQRTRSSAAA